MSAEADPLGYHVVPGTTLLDLLRRAHTGEDPDLLYAEAWANADHEDVPPTTDGGEQRG